MAKYLTGTTTTKVHNPETGKDEVVETTKVHRINVKPEDEFYMVFLKNTAPFFNIKYGDDIKVLAKLCEWAEFDKGIVYITSGRRKEISETLGIHKSNISTSLKRLKETNLLSGENGEFTINPVVFWKGSKATRMELMRKEGVQIMFNFALEHDIKPTSGIKPNTGF
jgi:hypothetical protein